VKLEKSSIQFFSAAKRTNAEDRHVLKHNKTRLAFLYFFVEDHLLLHHALKPSFGRFFRIQSGFHQLR